MRLLGVSPDWPRGSQACFQHTCCPGEMPVFSLGYLQPMALWLCELQLLLGNEVLPVGTHARPAPTALGCCLEACSGVQVGAGDGRS